MSKEELRLKILQELNEGRQPNHEDFPGVTEPEWRAAAIFLKDGGYIKNITISMNTKYLFAEITEDGENYLKQHTL
ncbi:hypothetical protein [Peribacillus kribbensis]|uniref:hypothetical protein n=1 Tax=Peribacillus kribbensis TaxID=356658 RepID=UPI00041F8EC8|nr:hypothetical protein [Peribacillus kribbensis]